MTRRIRRRTHALVGALAVAVGAASGASGQSLHLAELFADQGRLDDARAEVLAWFEIREQDATPEELQFGLWLRGSLAADREAGLVDIRRLVADYPEGPFTARGLSWLAAAAADRGDELEAAALYRRVALEHEGTESADFAWSWLRERGIPLPEKAPPEGAHAGEHPREAMIPAPAERAAAAADTLVAAADTVAPPLPADTAHVEAPPPATDTAPTLVTPPTDTAQVVAARDTVVTPPADTAQVQAPRDTVVTPPADTAQVVAARDTVVTPPADTAQAPPAAAPEPAPERIPHGPPVPGAAEGGAWAVQIGAFRNPVGAAGLVEELREAGFDARLVQVPMNDLLRVRIGRFGTQDEADALLERLRAAGRDGALVADARRETVVR